MGESTARVVVVTGGARGIGAAIGQVFLDDGALVIAVDLDEPEDPGRGVRSLRADVADWQSIEGAFRQIVDEFGRVDVLVNNAGIQRLGLIDQIDREDWKRVIDVHLYGTYHCSALALPLMKAVGRGAIVNISSVASSLALPGRGPYSAAKAAILGLTRVMAVEVASIGIRVNAVAPGFTRTAFIEQGMRDGSLDESWMIQEVPLGRLATPREIANVVKFLASDEASYITGQTIYVDGGWTILGIHKAPEWLSS
jgi:NAD(P)-dependent dehydrogenase (short-subunit alcohol dehydrogenase family)